MLTEKQAKWYADFANEMIGGLANDCEKHGLRFYRISPGTLQGFTFDPMELTIVNGATGETTVIPDAD